MTEKVFGPPGRQVEILSRERVYDAFFKLDVLNLRHERFDGGWSPILRRELFVQRPAVVVLPYDAMQDLVVLVEQFRTGCIDRPESPWLVEAVAGLVEPGEAPEAVAIRETREETGLELGRLEFACQYHASPGGTSERCHVYVGEVIAPDGGGMYGLAHEGEDIRTHIVPATTAFAMVDEGRIVAANGVVPLLWLRSNRDRLRQEWQRAAA